MLRLLPCLLLCLLAACEPAPPLRIAYYGAVSGRFSDLDSMGRDGAQLAVEMRNRAGGVRGRQVELLIRDAETQPERAAAVIDALRAQEVQAIVGPMTSRAAMPAVAAANRNGMVMVAGTATTTALSGRDDHFFRVIPDAAVAAAHAARHHVQAGWKKAALVVDVANADYVESWLSAYRQAFVAAGGHLAGVHRFDSRASRDYAAIATELLAMRPDLVVLSTEATDAALLAQKLRQQRPAMPLAASNWAATERLIELGGKSVEGMLVEQSFRRDDSSPAFQAFRAAFVARFAREPNVGGVAGFDAANVVLSTLEQAGRREEVKPALLAQRRFPALQGEIVFDDHGDSQGRMYLCRIKNGRFESVP